ncbi:hypothetical protein CJ030_MR4G014271 [Morella rubra]|uniref:Uncharacterized protein n=1 Tax=Morella rubra TaxID=262757 RepID=A0A6A1VVW5_9ROSI|nr:hypothetical protein CJ030_MR4G014271 [Morella rubra]
MASSPFNAKSRHHARSNSFPTRTRPLISEFNEHQAVAREQQEKWFNELLDGSLRLLDVVTVRKDPNTDQAKSADETLKRIEESHYMLHARQRERWPDTVDKLPDLC